MERKTPSFISAEKSTPEISAPRWRVSGRAETRSVTAAMVFRTPWIAQRADRLQEYDEVGLLRRSEFQRRQGLRAALGVVPYHLGQRIALAIVPVRCGQHEMAQRRHFERARLGFLERVGALLRVIVVAAREIRSEERRVGRECRERVAQDE